MNAKKSSVFSLQSSVSSQGFTLIEILVAMTILMLIVLMMAQLFQQSTIAYETGLRNAELGLKGRAVMNMMQQDLSQAVAGPGELACSFSGTGFEVCTLDKADDAQRTLRVVQYQGAGGGTLTRKESTFSFNPNSGTYGDYDAGTSVTLLTNAAFSVTTQSGSYTNNLPAWVELELELTKTFGGGGRIRVSSKGRDGVFDTPDDRDKRLRTW